MTTAIVADDAPLIREAIASVLEAAGMPVLAMVGTPKGLLDAVASNRPDVVIVDVRMPPSYTLEGLDAAIALRSADPLIGIMLLSQHVQPLYLNRLLLGGAAATGYLLKERAAGIDSFVDGVRTVAAGGCCFDSQVVAAMVASRVHRSAVESLTPREREVLQLMAEGASNAALAARLFLGEKTVESHIRRIFQRLDIPDEPDVNRRVRAVLVYLAATGP